MSSKNSKRALLSSLLALVLCVSMLVGTTFAWFTDSVTSGRNVIIAGNLDVDMEYLVDGSWKPVTETVPVFAQDILWEPGHTEVVYLRISNRGSLALKYQLGIQINTETGSVNGVGERFILSDYIEFSAIDGVQTPYADRAAARAAVTNAAILSDGYTKRGTMEAGSEPHYLALVVYMPESVGNEANHASHANPPEIDLGVSLFATQQSWESDSFGPDYDRDAPFPKLPFSVTYTAPIPGVDSENQLTDDMNIGDPGEAQNAVVPRNVLVDDGVSELTLDITPVDGEANIRMTDGQMRRSLDVKITGVSKNNTTPMTVNLGQVLPAGLKTTSVELYHVENGVPVPMECVETFTANNQFMYDPATGSVSIHVVAFSEFALIVAPSDPWDGTADTSWYTPEETSFRISTAEQLAGLGQLVANGNSFEGKTVLLTANLDLGGTASEQKTFYPIGYKSETPDEVYAFKGTFDGQGNRICNLNQNTWAIKGNYSGSYYNKSLGLFAYVENATVKNLVLENFRLEGEFAPAGCVAGRGNGGTFENIVLHRCNPATYNTGVAGIIGWDYGTNASYTFKDIHVDSTNTIIALWGSWDVACGGIMGFLDETSTANMINCTVGAKLDVYNDVCANYQYYQYRYAGMLIGTLGSNSTPASEKLSCTNCFVYYGDWSDYYYCEFVKNSQASYTEDFQFSRVAESDIIFDLEGHPVSCTHNHDDEREDRLAYHLPFYQLYTGYGWGSSPVSAHPGVTVSRYAYTVTYLNGTHVVGSEYVTSNAAPYTALIQAPSGYNWIDINSREVTSIPAGNEVDVVLYLNTKTQHMVRFVDANGVTVHEQPFEAGKSDADYNATILEPAVPAVPGHIGLWPAYYGWLREAKGDVVIRPVYSIDPNFDLEGIVDIDFNLAQLFERLSKGQSLAMYQDLAGNIANASQSTFATITLDDPETVSKDVRLDLDSFELKYTGGSNANKDWTLFHILNGSSLTLGGGFTDSGTLVFVFDKLNSNAYPCIFDLDVGGKLILERGVSIEAKFKKSINMNLTQQVAAMIKGVSGATEEGSYPGLYIRTDSESDPDYDIVRIIVTGDTTLIGDIT